MLASIGGDSRLRTWDTTSGKQIQSVAFDALFGVFASTVALSGDGKTVAISYSNEIFVCDVGKSEPRLKIDHHDNVAGIAFSPTSNLLAVLGSTPTVSLLDSATGAEVRKLTGHDKGVVGAAFSADGKTIATIGEDRTCRIWNVADGKPIRRLDANEKQRYLVALSADGKTVAWWDDDGMVTVVDVASGKELTSFKAGGSLFSLDWRQSILLFAPDGSVLALYWSSHLFHWRPDKGLTKRDFEPASGKTAYGRIAPDGKSAALWDWDHGTALHLFDVESGKERILVEGHTKWATAIARPGGKLIASTSTDGTILLWDAATTREVRRWRPGSTWQPIAFLPDGKALASAAYDGKSFIRIADVESGKQLQRFETERTHDFVISADGKKMVCCDFNRIEVWDVSQGKRLRELEDVPETKLPVLKLSSRGPWLSYHVSSLTLTPDGAMAAAAFVRTNSECSVYLWDTATGKTLPGWPGDKQLQSPIAFSPDGKFLAGVQQRMEREYDIVLWDVAKGKLVKRLPFADYSCKSMAFSKDGVKLAVSGYYQGDVQIYDLATNKEIVRFKPHDRAANLSFSDDGGTLMTSSEDTTILVWDLKAIRKK